jgi:hypothetical protein
VLSSSIVHSSRYSQYDSYIGPPPNQLGDSTRADEQLSLKAAGLTSGLLDFRINIWIYVPSVVDGQAVTFPNPNSVCAGCGWISFATIDSVGGSTTPITVDSFSDHALHLWVADNNTVVGHVINQTGPNIVQWPFDTWWELSLEGHLQPPNGEIILYFNNVPFLTYEGMALPASFTYAHFGLYVGGFQGTYGIYNDDVSVYELPS